MTLEGSRKFIAMWLGILGSYIVAKFGPEWGGVWATGQMVLVPFLGSAVYMMFNYVQKTNADTFVPENWLAGKRTMVGLVLAIVAPLLTAATVETKDAIAQTLTMVAELLTPVAYMLFQSLSDKKLSAPATPTVTVASQSPVYAPVTVTGPAPVVTYAAPVVQVAQIKDRIDSTVKLINKDTKWDFLMGIWGEKLEAAGAHMLSVNPNMTVKDQAKILSKYANGVLNEEDCRNVQSVMGLAQVLHAQNDILIMQSFQAAEKAGTLSKAMSESLLQSAIRGVAMGIINDGISRVQNDSAPISIRRQALTEFGLPQDVADRAMFSGGAAQINWMGGWRSFDGYALAGFDTGI